MKLSRFLLYKLNHNIITKNIYSIFKNKYSNKLKPIKIIQFELSSKCNLKCSFCSQQFKQNQGTFMTLEKAEKYIEKLPKSIKQVNLHFSGESFYNKEIPEIVKLFSERGIFTSVSSNGTIDANLYIKALNNGLNKLIFAIDGAKPETHEKYRIGSSLQKTLKTLEKVIKNKPETSLVGVQFLVTKYSENEIEAMKTILIKMKADFLNLKTISLDIAGNEKVNADIKKSMEILPKNDKYSRYRIRNEKPEMKYPIVVCPYIYEPTIGADGEVALCCIDIDNQVKIGNLNNYNSFEELWDTEKYKKIRQAVLHKELTLCKKCNYSPIGLQAVKVS